MKKTCSAIVVLAMLAAAVNAGQVKPVTVDLRRENKPFAHSAAVQTTPLFRMYVRQDGVPYTGINNWTGVFHFAESPGSTEGMVITNTAWGPDYMDFRLTVNQTAVAGDYWASFVLYSAPEIIEDWVNGIFRVTPHPLTGGGTAWEWGYTNTWEAIVQQKIQEAFGGDFEMDGDVLGAFAESIVVGLRDRPLATTAPEEGQSLVWDGSEWAPGDVSGAQDADLILLRDTNIPDAIASNETGLYRRQLPAGNFGMMLNVGGAEIGYIDMYGLTLFSGSVTLFSDVMTVNLAAYDGSLAEPSIAFTGGPSWGFYRFATNGTYAVGAAASGVRPFWYSPTGLHFDSGDLLYGDGRLRRNERIHARAETFIADWFLVVPGQYISGGGDLLYGTLDGGDAVIGTNGYVTLMLSRMMSGWSINATTNNARLIVSGWDNGSWVPLGNSSAGLTTNAVYSRLRITAEATGGAPECTIHDVTVYRWEYDSQAGAVQDTAGMRFRADEPSIARDVATKNYVDAAIAGVAAAAFVPTDLATDYSADHIALTNAIAGKQDAGDYLTPFSVLNWQNLTNLPTTVIGYGITDAVTGTPWTASIETNAGHIAALVSTQTTHAARIGSNEVNITVLQGGTQDWSTAYSWGDWSSHMSAVSTRVDVVEAWPTNQWIDAYSWGDHSTGGYALATMVVTQVWDVSQYPLAVTGTPWASEGYLTVEAETAWHGGTGALWTAIGGKQDAGAYLTHDSDLNWNNITNTPTLFDGSWTNLTDVPSEFAPASHSHDWGNVTNTPTTLAGYGIANDFVKTNHQGNLMIDGALVVSNEFTTLGPTTRLGSSVMSLNAATVYPDAVAFGSGTTAENWSLAAGRDSTAKMYSLAAGWGTTAEQYGIASGKLTATHFYGAAFGHYSVAGKYALAAGDAVQASDYAAAFGLYSQAGAYGFAAGRSGKAGEGSFVFKDGTSMEWDRSAETNAFSVKAEGGAFFDVPLLEVSGVIEAGEHYSVGLYTGINITNTWIDSLGVTNTQVFVGGILTDWTQDGP